MDEPLMSIRRFFVICSTPSDRPNPVLGFSATLALVDSVKVAFFDLALLSGELVSGSELEGELETSIFAGFGVLLCASDSLLELELDESSGPLDEEGTFFEGTLALCLPVDAVLEMESEDNVRLESRGRIADLLWSS